MDYHTPIAALKLTPETRAALIANAVRPLQQRTLAYHRWLQRTRHHCQHPLAACVSESIEAPWLVQLTFCVCGRIWKEVESA